MIAVLSLIVSCTFPAPVRYLSGKQQEIDVIAILGFLGSPMISVSYISSIYKNCEVGSMSLPCCLIC